MPGALELIAWPYHAGRLDEGMGLGASVLAADEELLGELRGAGWDPTVRRVPPVEAGRPEIARVIELDRRLARLVAAAGERGAFPLVLAGNCGSCLGTAAGVGADGLGVVWLDAHADFDTPDDNLSGFFDVMALAILTGTGWSALAGTIPGFSPLRESDVVLAGVRDLEPYQRSRLGRSTMRIVPGAMSERGFAGALDALRRDVERVYLHVDLDVLDTAVGRANEYAAPGGPDVETVVAAIEGVFGRFDVAAAALTAYDPGLDADGRVAAAARRLAAAIATGAAAQA